MLLSYVARLTNTGIGAWRRPAVSVVDEVRTPLVISPAEIDVYAHMNNGKYFTLMDVGRWELAIRTGLLRAAMRHGWRPVAVSVAARFKKELTAFDRVELTSAIRAWDEKYFYVEHRFEKAGALHAQGFVQIVSKRARVTVPPAELFAQVGYSGPSPAADDALAAWITSLGRTPPR